MKIIYVANDGKQFYDKYDCEAYEHKNKIKDNHIILLDEYGNLLDSANENNFIESTYINIKNKEDLEIIKEIEEYIGCILPDKIGQFYYDNIDYEWHLIDDKIEELEKFKRIKEKMSEY